MKPEVCSKQRGQIAVLVALCMVVLLVYVALIVDGTNAFQQRRRCQNAADAAALAGVVEMKAIGTTNTKVYNVTVNYVTQHIGTPDAFEAQYVNSSKSVIGPVTSFGAASGPPATAAGIYVYSQNKYGLFFGSLVSGQKNKVSSASAIAATTGALGSVNGGALPIGVPLDALSGIMSGAQVRIWDDAKISLDSAGNSGLPIGSADGNRGWLNANWNWNIDPSRQSRHNTLDGSNSNSVLTSYVLGPAQQGGALSPPDFAGPIIPGTAPPSPPINSSTAGDFIQGNPGNKTSSIDAASSRIGTTVLIPIYDFYYSGSQVNAAFGSLSGFSSASTGQDYLHIVGFAGFTIDAVVTQGNSKYIQGKFVSRLVDGFDGSAGGGVTSVPGVAQAISLVQ